MKKLSIYVKQDRLIAFTVSAAVLILQLVQTRILSVIFWNHFVYAIVALVLLGFGISGTVLALGTDTFLRRILDKRRAAVGFIFSSLASTLLFPTLSVSITSLFSSEAQLLQLGLP